MVHDPSRLAILTALSSCRSAEFLFLQSLIGMTKGNLSGHLIKLEQGGPVKIVKSFKGKNATRSGVKGSGSSQLRRAADKWGPSARHE